MRTHCHPWVQSALSASSEVGGLNTCVTRHSTTSYGQSGPVYKNSGPPSLLISRAYILNFVPTLCISRIAFEQETFVLPG
jgi:hypothetical protein